MTVPVKSQLNHIIDHNEPDEVFNEVKKTFLYNYTNESFLAIEHVYEMVSSLYSGSFPGYKRCNTEYHDFNHINHVFLATARIIDGLNIHQGAFDKTKAVNLLIAALLHDTGYIQEDHDTDGTGAKYIATHVSRGIEFTKKNYKMLNLLSEDIPAIASLIECTNTSPDPIDKLSGENLLCGSIIATADIIGQMSDRIYLEKLLFLYYEFVEAGVEGYNTAFDILRKTHMFYKSTMDRLDVKLCASYDLSKYHFNVRYNIDGNLYMTAIENQITYLQKIMDDSGSNFRDKLHRLNIKEILKAK
jgi:hypothetical protein